MRIKPDIKLDFKDVLLEPKRSILSSRRSVNLERNFIFRHWDKTTISWSGIPIISSNMDGVGTFSMAMVLQEFGVLTAIKKHYTFDDWKFAVINKGLRLNNVIVCIGTNAMWEDNAEDYATAKSVLTEWPEIKFICIDVANGYQQNFVDFVKRVRDDFPDKVLIAGNVITAEMTEQLIISGAEIVKCGIGPGSVCTTREQTGVGVPQLSGVMECADAAHGLSGHVIADGGCTVPGDVTKAFGAGADFVMLGGMLAFHDESETELENGKYEFYGMSSDRAKEVHGARKDGYTSTEGKRVIIEAKGSVRVTIKNILGGLRSACTMIGARRIKDIPKCTTFVMVNNQQNQIYEKI